MKETARFRAISPQQDDGHLAGGFDGDNDGIGCET
jgi:hypothetical protein